jgi:hypothetical protein
VSDEISVPEAVNAVPALTACSLCAGETLATTDDLPGGQAERLRRMAERLTARLTWVECLDECERGDVVVARATADRRRSGAEPVWFERLAGERLTLDLQDWLTEGGPGAAPLPRSLHERVIVRASSTGTA